LNPLPAAQLENVYLDVLLVQMTVFIT